MNPNSGYYQGTNRQTYGGSGNPGSGRQVQYRASSTYGGCPTPRPRAPPTFNSAPQNGYPQQGAIRGSRNARPVQSIGRCNQYTRGPSSSATSFQQAQHQQAQHQQQASYKPVRLPSSRQTPRTQQQSASSQQQNGAPQAIKVNISADQLMNAKKTPIFQDRSEACADQGDGSMKYIQLNWQDLLGGMDNLRVTMAPSADTNNPNRQLRVSFGGQTGQINAGETPLKVVSIEPANTTPQPGMPNPYAAQMTASAPTNMRKAPASSAYNPYSGSSYRQPVGGKAFGRR